MRRLIIALGLFTAFSAYSQNADLRQAQSLFEQGDSQGASALLQSLIKKYPGAPEPYNNLAVISASQGDYEQAEAYLQQSLGSHPGYQLAYKNLRDLQKNKALTAYKKSLALSNKQDKPSLEYANSLSLQQQTLPENQITQCEDSSTISKASPPALQDTIQSWAKAWSDQDSQAYIAHYQNSYQTDVLSHELWREQRQSRLARPRFIEVKLSDISTQPLGDDSALVTFKQHYRSDTINDSVRKMLVMVIEDAQWKIAREQVIR